MSESARWPSLRLADWADTRETLHMWLQIVGKIEMVSTSLVNHWWNVSYSMSARGFRTGLMRGDGEAFDAEFDLVDHVLVFRATGGGVRTVKLAPKSVAQFWSEVQDALGGLGIDRAIVASPNEVSPAIPFAEDTEHNSYDATAVNTFYRQMLAADHVFSEWRAGFAGKDSPVQLFWGSMDLSCARFSGRTAPPHQGNPPACPAWVMAEAESRENSAAGFWPGGSDEGTFYAYVYPEPDGYRDATMSPGRFDTDLGEWVLPYEEVRTSADPDATLMAFLQNTYVLAADLADWDRGTLEVDPHRLDDHIYRHNDDRRLRPKGSRS